MLLPASFRSKLNFIDVIQRLGVSYLFESDIDQMLCDLYHQGCGDDYVHDHDLQMVALRFRLLRQQGHYVSCGGISATSIISQNNMKYFYNQLLDVYKEIETGLAEQGRSYRVDYAKEAMKKQVQAYFVEARWLHENYMPTMDEYMRISLISSGYPLLTCISFVGMGDIVTKDAFEWLSKDPKIVKAASVIARLMDDIVSHKFEQERGHVASAIECYMNQHEVAEEQASDELRRQVVEAWKDINEELLIIPKDHVPIPLLTRVLNLARVMDVMYKDGDGYTNANGKAEEQQQAAAAYYESSLSGDSKNNKLTIKQERSFGDWESDHRSIANQQQGNSNRIGLYPSSAAIGLQRQSSGSSFGESSLSGEYYPPTTLSTGGGNEIDQAYGYEDGSLGTVG
ncbi:hypothetical protein D5086_022528 [Populus alba]|uniref:Uncharacterized protein n=1 Tax=Populus alba TaxID=43335 RepID=A0ACC4BFD8_POPAL